MTFTSTAHDAPQISVYDAIGLYRLALLGALLTPCLDQLLMDLHPRGVRHTHSLAANICGPTTENRRCRATYSSLRLTRYQDFKKANSATSAILSPTPATGPVIPATKATGASVTPALIVTIPVLTLFCLLPTNPTRQKVPLFDKVQNPILVSSP